MIPTKFSFFRLVKIFRGISDKDLITAKYLDSLTSHEDANFSGLKIVEPLPIHDQEAPFYLVGVECYNPGKESVILVNEIILMCLTAAQYIQKMDGHLGPKYVEIPPDSFRYIPHQFYMTYTRSGAPAKLVKGYGKEKFKGHKTQSAPEPFKRSF